MYRDKTICVYSTDKHYEAEIEYLCSLAKKVYVFPMYKGYEIKPSNAEVVLKNRFQSFDADAQNY